MPTTLPLEAHKNRSLSLEHARNIGRAYRSQALELISICQILSRIASPKSMHEDVELRRIFRVCDMALRSAADSGKKVTDEANSRFKEATQLLSGHLERRHCLDLTLNVSSRTEIETPNDSVESLWSHVVKRATLDLQKSEDESGPAMTINFVLLQFPLLASRDPDTVIVSQEFSTSPSLPEILWNFSHYKDRARITLEQNPHFYSRCPTDESAYTPMFQRRPLQDPIGALEHNDTVYVLVDGPGRVFLHSKRKFRVYGNVWSLNGCLIFRDRSGVLEGEQLVRNHDVKGNLWYCEEQIVFQDSEPCPRLNHRHLYPIATTSADCIARPRRILEDWTALNRPASRSVIEHIDDSRGYQGYVDSLDLPPPPPTSGRPGYPVSYTTINTLDDDTLLGIFTYYRLDEENGWNVRLGWLKLFHICRRWRHLLLSWAFHLGMHILCTNGAPKLDTLDHLPSLPLFIDYRDTTATITRQDELGIRHALSLCGRIRRIVLHLPPSILYNILMLMDKPFSMLEHLSLSSTTKGDTALVLPKTFLAPDLRHLTLFGIDLPKRLRLLSSAASLVTLALTNIRVSGYFHPRLLAARLQSLPRLEELSIGFSVPIPRNSAERELLIKWGTPVTLPNLKHLEFKGVSAYLDCFVAQIRVPFLERLHITFFNQIAFALPHLFHFANITEVLKLPIAEVRFGRDAVVVMGHHYTGGHNRHFSLRVMCRQLDWQIDRAAQICSALMPALFGVEELRLEYYEQMIPTEWQNGEIDGITWHELLRAFIGVKELHICPALLQELSRALQVDDVGSDPGFLPVLWDIMREFEGSRADNLFSSFIRARQIVGRPLIVREVTLGDVIKTVKRFRILLIGRSGVGKSSLINRVFGINAAHVEDYKAGEADIQQEFVSPENQYLVLHDSKGFEPGDLSNYETVRTFIQQRSRPEQPLGERIHVLWFCTETPTAGGRVFKTGDEMLLQFAHENRVPIVIVFTRYDLLVRTKVAEWKEVPDIDPTRLRDWSVEEARKAFEISLRSLQRTMVELEIPMPRYATVSVRPGHQEGVSSLVNVTQDIVKERVKGDAWVLWAIAQRASLKINACLTKVNGYYRHALTELGQLYLRECLETVHRDISTCWDFKGEDLNSPDFQTVIFRLVQDVHTKPNVSSLANMFKTPLTAASAPIADSFVQWLSTAVLEDVPPVQRLLIAYPVALISVLRELFHRTLRLNSTPTITWTELQAAFNVYARSSFRQRIHERICSKTTRDEQILSADGISRMIRELLQECF